jgi:hypothetical protein
MQIERMTIPGPGFIPQPAIEASKHNHKFPYYAETPFTDALSNLSQAIIISVLCVEVPRELYPTPFERAATSLIYSSGEQHMTVGTLTDECLFRERYLLPI